MPLFERLRNAVTKAILKSPARSLISRETAMLTFTDPQSGKYLTFPVIYEKIDNLILVFYPRKEACWKKFEHGAPVKIVIDGETYSGWAEVFDEKQTGFQPILSKSEMADQFLPEDSSREDYSFAELQAALTDICILKIKLS